MYGTCRLDENAGPIASEGCQGAQTPERLEIEKLVVPPPHPKKVAAGVSIADRLDVAFFTRCQQGFVCWFGMHNIGSYGELFVI